MVELNLRRFGKKKAEEALEMFNLPDSFPRSHLIYLLFEQSKEIEELEAEVKRLETLLSNQRGD